MLIIIFLIFVIYVLVNIVYRKIYSFNNIHANITALIFVILVIIEGFMIDFLEKVYPSYQMLWGMAWGALIAVTYILLGIFLKKYLGWGEYKHPSEISEKE